MPFARLATAAILTLVTSLSTKADDSRSLWEGFRKLHPYHLQVVCLSKPDTDGTRVLIVSEPPPHATLDAIKACSSLPLRAVSVEQQKIGHDGWVRDVVATLPPMSGEQSNEFVDALHDYLFGTAYKAEALGLPLEPLPAGANKFDLDVSALELDAWAFKTGEQFRAIEGSKPLSVKEILDGRRSGVYVSQRKKGLVLWSLPRGVSLEGRRAEARQFAVDSDLVLGAVATKSQVAIFGRERTAAMRLLPPLRFETLNLLASVKSDELAQSYERNRIFAGRFEKGRDWAPIHLSPELLNTEYGSLLNITDQLLKSWSNSGLIKYESFDYPQPGSWPFQRPLIHFLNASSLTFNWNTAGAGYSLQSGDMEVLALKRTGALPVSYIPETKGASTEGHNKTADAETTAYNYFANLGDPNLVRVVQYAAAYQIFRKFGSAEDRQSSPTPEQTKAIRVLTEHAQQAINAFRIADEPRLQRAVDHLLGDEKSSKTDSAAMFVAKQLKSNLGEIHELWGEKGIEDLAESFADPRSVAMANHEKSILVDKSKNAKKVSKLSDDTLRRLVILQTSRELLGGARRRFFAEFVNIAAVKDSYAAQFQTNRDGWIQTPSIVVSSPTGELADGIGGHNLGARVSAFKPGDVPQGKVKIVREGGKVSVEYNEADQAKIPEIVRRVGKEADNPRLQSLVEGDLARAKTRYIREPEQALYARTKSEEPGLLRGYGHQGASTQTSGWERANGFASKAAEFRVTQLATGFQVATLDGDIFQAHSRRSLVELLTTQKTRMTADKVFRMEFVDTAPQDVINILKSCRLRSSRRAALQKKLEAGKSVSALDEVMERSASANEKQSADSKFPDEDSGEFRTRLSRRGRSDADFKSMIADYNLSKLEVRQGQPRLITEGPRAGLYEHSIEVEAPAIKAGRPSFFVRLRLYAKSLVSGLGARAKALITQALSRLNEGPQALPDIAAQLKAELKRHDIDVDVEIEAGYGQEVTDSCYAHFANERDNSTRGVTADEEANRATCREADRPA